MGAAALIEAIGDASVITFDGIWQIGMGLDTENGDGSETC